MKETLGAEELAVHEGEGGTIEHAELVVGGDVIMLGSDRSAGEERYATSRSVTYVAVDDVEARHERASAAGASPSDLVEQDYGSTDFSVEDPEGNTWALGTYRPQRDD